MHDCPRCQVPLHGHERFCPACGAKQYVKPEYRDLQSDKSNFNPMSIVIAIAIIGGLTFVIVQNSWIGKALTYKAPQEDPMSKMTPVDARKMMADKLNANFAQFGAKADLKWMSGDEKADPNSPGTITLSINTNLKNADDHKAIIDPIKEMMDPAKVSSITVVDAKSHKTWTYNLAPVETTTDAQDQ